MSLGTVAELAARVGGTAVGGAELVVGRITAIDEAGPDALTFATTAAYFQSALSSRAGAILVDEAVYRQSKAGAAGKALILVPSARVALMQILHQLDRPRPRGPQRHSSAVVDAAADIGQDVVIGPHVVIGARSRIGNGVVLHAGVFIGDDAEVGEGALLYPHARVMDGCTVGKRAIVHSGATIGSDGFGYVFVEGHFERIPQIGNAVLGDDVEVGANTCIDRAQTGSTSIGEGTKIDNLCQIGHNCRIGRHGGIAAQTGLAGSTILGDYVLVGGQAGFKGHITIGSRVKVGAGSAVWSDVPDDAFVSGRPARPHSDDLRREVMVRNLPKLIARVEALEKEERP